MFNPKATVLQSMDPEPTPTGLEDETRDPIDENRKKEEHLFLIVQHPTTAHSASGLG